MTRGRSTTEPTNTPDATEAATLQARNSAAFWTATGRSRDHEVIRERGFVAVKGDERTGLRILVQEPDLDAGERSDLSELVQRARGPVNVEDPFAATDLSHLGMRGWQMPVMLRPPGLAAAEPALDVVRVQRPKDLRAAERIVIEGFELTSFEPHRPGELFPDALLEQPGVDVFLALHEGTPAGAAVTIVAEAVTGHYWVATPPAFRSRGVARAVMQSSLTHLPPHRATLTASTPGRPLYESLGYTTATPSTWWAST